MADARIDLFDAIIAYEAQDYDLDINQFALSEEQAAELARLIRNALEEERPLTGEELAPFQEDPPGDIIL